ncbi:hypothetical protein J6590_042679 [Homalodisca vitripennis]|nr:hypothetical protein J6590_042679 [Homalodisca vitripennis]
MSVVISQPSSADLIAVRRAQGHSEPRVGRSVCNSACDGEPNLVRCAENCGAVCHLNCVPQKTRSSKKDWICNSCKPENHDHQQGVSSQHYRGIQERNAERVEEDCHRERWPQHLVELPQYHS